MKVQNCKVTPDKFSLNYAHKWAINCITINLQFLLASQYGMKHFQVCRHHKFFPEQSVQVSSSQTTSNNSKGTMLLFSET